MPASPRNPSSQAPRRPSDRDIPRRAAVYARVSQDQTGEGASVAQQQDAARDLIDRRGWTVAGVYVDNSITGTGKKHRPEFYAMIAAVKAGEVDAIVARHMDRIARNSRERLELVEACRNQGVIIALVEGSDMDPTTASGRMVIDVLGSVAEMEIGIKSERHIAAIERRAKAGKAPTCPPLLGYTSDGNVDPEGAEVVRRIFKAFHAGESLRGIAAALTADGIPTARSGKPWTAAAVRVLLMNPRFAGWVRHRGRIATDADEHRIRGTWEPLVTDEMFDVVQARLADPARKRNRTGTERKYLGSGLYVCAVCETKLRSADGDRYRCPTEAKGHPNRIRHHIDSFVLDVIAEKLAQPALAELLAPVGEDMAPVVAEAARLRDRLAVQFADYKAGHLTGSEYRDAKESISAELREVDKKLATRTGGAALGGVVAAPDPAAAFREASLMAQRAVIDALCVVVVDRGHRGRLPDGAYVDPSTVRIEWRR